MIRYLWTIIVAQFVKLIRFINATLDDKSIFLTDVYVIKFIKREMQIAIIMVCQKTEIYSIFNMRLAEERLLTL